MASSPSSPRLASTRPLGRVAAATRALYEKLAGPEKKFARAMVLGSAVLVGGAGIGCSGGDLPPYLAGDVPSSHNYKSGPCAEGAEHHCSATLDQANGVLSCWEGTQQCVEGVWGPCMGTLSTRVDPRHEAYRGSFRSLALSEPVECVGNPCDPGCQVFHEDPPDITGTPGGGGEIPEWENPGGTAPCDHQLCEEGTALDASCHPCVASVCAVDATCCTDAWTTACADLVLTECNVTPEDPPISICDFSVYSETTFRTNGGSGTISGGPIGAGDTGSEAIRLNNITVDSVTTPGSVFLDNTSVVGDVTVGGTIGKQNTVVIGGTETSGATVEVPTIPTKDLTCLTASGSTDLNSGTHTIASGDTRRININNNAVRVILSEPGDYAYIHFNAPGTLIFAQPGTYTFNRLYMGGSNPTLLMPPTGTVNIDVCTDLHFDNGVQTYAWTSAPAYTSSGTPPDPLLLQWYTNDTELKIGPGALASGVLVAPHATVHAYGGATLYGLIYSNAFVGEPGFSLDSTGLIGEACRDAGVGGEPPGCPVTLDIPDMPPAMNEPCRSGLDCQVNSRCTNVATDATCDHSKCVEGAALDEGCDPCVARICAEDPACCTGSWDASCVDKVKTVCDAWCGSVTGCAHPVCNVGGPLADDCSTCAGTVCAEPGLEYCCTTAWDANCVASAETLCGGGGPPSPDYFACDYAVMGANIVTGYATTIRGGNVRTGSGISSINADWGIRSQIEGSVHAPGSFTLSSSDVTGDVQVGGTWNNWSGSVGGTVGSSPLDHAIPTKTLTCPTGGTNQNITSNTTLAPGTYGNVTVSNWGTTLTLQAGTYQLSSLILNGDTRLQMPATGTVVIDVCGRVYVGNNARIVGLSSGADALRLQVYSASTAIDPWNCSANAICIEQSGNATGIFSAPAGGGALGQYARLYGQLRALTVNLRQASLLDASGSTGDACRTAMSVCTVATPDPTVDETGECVANASGFTDGTCATADLAVDMPCGTEIPVCNHGPIDAPAGAELTFFPRSGQQFATTRPDAAWALGTCTVTAPIPAGECVTQTCDPALLDEDMTILVNGGGAIPECSGLDNWSLFVDAACGGDPVVVTEIYEATCPYATSALWGQLAWQTTTPGASSVTWSARTAFTEAELASAPWTAVGVASQSPTDTQSCTLPSDSGSCPVDLTDALWGTERRNQPAFLELRMELESSGADVPTVHDWKVTYSCVFDE